MVLSRNSQDPFPRLFILSGLLLLTIGLLFGLAGSLLYIVPGIMKDFLSFEKIRPLHVSSVLFWIILSASGCVLTYVQEYRGKRIYSNLLLKCQFILFILAILFILTSYCAGIFGGREYWEYPPVLSLPILLGWICFLVNFVGSIGSFRKQPVYVWMWLTGIIFFLFTFLESYLWLFPYFRNNIVNDMTIQWKSNGSMVGSWNMLVYGCSLFLMDKMSGSKTSSHSWMAFLLYFAGLFNLMFNWGHHIYTLPTHAYVKHISYAVSMTELIILGRIIYKWKASLSAAQKHFYRPGYRFLASAEVWIFLNLLLAILMSVPALNVYTHGTHVTVAHAMGTTIGINTMLLLAVIYDLFGSNCRPFENCYRLLAIGYWLANLSLFIFWIALIGAGIWKAGWQMSRVQIPFSSMILQLRPFFIFVFIAGILLALGLILTVYPIVKHMLASFSKQNSMGSNDENVLK